MIRPGTGCYTAHLGKGVLYLVTMPHENPDAYNKLKSMAGKNVAVTGHVYTRSGLKAIEVKAFKPAT